LRARERNSGQDAENDAEDKGADCTSRFLHTFSCELQRGSNRRRLRMSYRRTVREVKRTPAMVKRAKKVYCRVLKPGADLVAIAGGDKNIA
jgi:hypothetical protein